MSNFVEPDLAALVERFRSEVESPHRGSPYVAQPYPTALDEALEALIHGFFAAPPPERAELIAELAPTERQSQVILAFAERMATQAMRDADPLLVRAGLIATLLEAERTDTRESIIVLTLLHDALGKTGGDPRREFAEVAGLAPGSPASELIRDFPCRAPENLTLESMGYRMAMSPQGVKYEADPAVWRK